MRQVVMTATYIHSEIHAMVDDCIRKTEYHEMRDDLLSMTYNLIDPAADVNILKFRDTKNTKGVDNLYDSSLLDYFIEKLKKETDKAINPVVIDYTILNAIEKVHEWKIRVLLLYCVEYITSLKIKIQQEKY